MFIRNFFEGPIRNITSSSSENAEEKEGQLRKEITPEEIERIEKSEMKIDDKVNFLLTRGGLKPASEMWVTTKTEHEDGKVDHRERKKILEILDIIKESGLIYRLKGKEIEDQKVYKHEHIRVLVARSQKDMEFLEKTLESDSDKEIGKAFGFPPTAVETFVGKRKRLDRRSLPSNIQKSDGVLFSSPTLSEDNWQEEIKQGERYGQFIKKLSPKIYKEMRFMALKTLEDS